MKADLRGKIGVWLIPGIKSHHTPESIIKFVGECVKKDILMKTRDHLWLIPRQLATYIIKKVLLMDEKDIAPYFHQDRSNIYNSIKSISNLMETDKNFLIKYGFILGFYGLAPKHENYFMTPNDFDKAIKNKKVRRCFYRPNKSIQYTDGIMWFNSEGNLLIDPDNYN